MRPTFLALLLSVLLLPALARAQGAPPDLEAEDTERDKGHFVEITPAVVSAIDAGLAYLARSQNPDGSWTSNVGFKLNASYQITKQQGRHVGVTALALMSFLAGGHLPGTGQYGANVRRGLDFILNATRTDGFITYDGSRMYSHAFATLFLAEIYGMSDDEELRNRVREKLELAVKLIVECQNSQGAWRYVPYAIDSDMSITVCQLQALRAARNVGIRVPQDTIDRAIDYVRRSASHRGGKVVTFDYQIDRRTRYSFALTAAGITSLHSAGVYSDAVIEPALQYLKDHRRDTRNDHIQIGYYFYWYGHYYAVQAMFQRGGRWWEEWWGYISHELVTRQLSDGTWPELQDIGKSFSTAIATLILQVPFRYLPILQR
jgi:prenyltransferase beta subunit